ncbi:methyltransferase family protein [Brucella endophytica]|nr:isoprenylcysteine carboxylmethyltransferase family protein [Brucella endophytica]
MIPTDRLGLATALSRFQHQRRQAAFLIIVLTIGLLFFLQARSSEFTVGIVETFGIGLIAAAIIGRLWSTLYIGGRKNGELVASGPYSITRNPLYLFSAIAAAGAGAQTGSIVVMLAFAACTCIIFAVVIRREEKYLRQTFDEYYDEYCVRVPRFLPRFSAFVDMDWVMVSPKRLYATFLDGLVFFAAVPVSEGIDWLQQQGMIPVLLRLP